MLAILLAAALTTDLSRAQLLIASGHFEAAVAIADHERPCEAEVIRGAVDEARESLASATQHYAHALELARATDPALLPAASEGLQRMYGQQGRIDLSLDLANRMLQLDPGHRALYLYARGLAFSGLN